MITGLAIQNFKGIGERVELELKPITLLFGPNSAGKSTILHALHYAREVFERRNYDADQTIAGGEFVDLGGFRNVLNNRDPNRSVVIAITLALQGMPQFFHDEGEDGDRFPTVRITSATVEVSLSWSEFFQKVYCSAYAVSLNQEPFARICSYPDRVWAVVLEKLNLNHSILNSTPAHVDSDESHDDDLEEYDWDEIEKIQTELGLLRNEVPILGQTDALPDWNKMLRLEFGTTTPEPTQDLDSDWREDLSTVLSRDNEGSADAWVIQDKCKHFLSRYIVGPGTLVAAALQKSLYLGPLRKTPPRNYQPPRFSVPSRWASGLGAWDALEKGTEELVEKVSEWLEDEDRLDSGYRIERRTYKEIDLADPLIVKLLTGRAFDEADEGSRVQFTKSASQIRIVVVPKGTELELRPHDVGVGISQLVPVVVMALDGKSRLLTIEQPELHLHPRLQAQLGDLFIEGAKSEGQRFLIETHSEHLILRIQRRTREGTLSPNDVAVVYVQQVGSNTRADMLRLDEEGDFADDWPGGFFPERLREL